VGWARTTASVALRGAAALYVDFFRSMPPIVLISFPYLLVLVALNSQHTNINPYVAENIALWVGAFALSLHTSAYQAEIVRAGILSVPATQTEAADAIGLSRLRAMFLVTLPQAFRVSLPALGNEFSSVIKDTSLLSVIGWLELSGIGLLQVYAGLRVYAYAPLLVWLEIAVLYFVLTFAVNTTVRTIENAFKVPGLEAPI
jgi:ABC-type amino acid transport system permease subunit